MKTARSNNFNEYRETLNEKIPVIPYTRKIMELWKYLNKKKGNKE